MGLSWSSLKFLCAARSQGVQFTKTITIGRLHLFVLPAKARQLMLEYEITPPAGCEGIPENGLFAEPVFHYLGADVVDSIDASDYENATFVHDLNKPIPEDLHASYDVVYDGGTLEHVFNLPQALKNCMEMTRVGGSLFIHTPANNWLGHGFYQVSPEFFYRALSADNGFEIERLILHESYEFGRWYEVPDPNKIHSRIELSNPWIGIHVLVHARRICEAPIFEKPPQQSDYSSRWVNSGFNNETESIPAQAATPPLSRRAVLWLKQTMPWMVSAKHRLNHRYPFLARAWNRRRSIQYHKTHSPAAQADRFRSVST